MQTLLRPQVLRYGRPLVHRTVRFSRRYNGFNNTGPHTTYFQPPPEPPKPRRRWLRSTLFSVFFIGLGALGNEFVQDYRAVSEELEVLRNPEAAREAALLDEVLKDVLPLQHSLYVPAMTLDAAQDLLESKAAYQVSSKAVAHVAQLGSNMPCEGTVLYLLLSKRFADFCQTLKHPAPTLFLVIPRETGHYGASSTDTPDPGPLDFCEKISRVSLGVNYSRRMSSPVDMCPMTFTSRR